MNVIDIIREHPAARPARHWPKAWLMALVLVAGLPPVSTQAQAQSQAPHTSEPQTPDERLRAARACADSPSRLGRLECYDALFRDQRPAEPQEARSPLWQAVAAQEAERDNDDFGLRVSKWPDSVLMSVPALGTLPPRPLLVISCDDAITRFQLHLSEPLEAKRAPLKLHGEGVTLDQTWRMLGNGHVVSGGRGLPAIGTLKRLLGGEQLRLTSELADIDGLRFQLTGWRTAIEPLRTMCRW
ncbi:type VI secretion system-associated protein VasI [Onishia niordana]|uniref:type VI secretion system-associated protein VasI n=1 Tax=Onishia niordana TaxID=2508711 RepID=UPI00197A92EC|nr:type VI secretion system-associated protein VasI [Halomonas niordiana]